MDESTNDGWVVGVDGCPAGWLAAFVGSAGTTPRVKVFARFADILAEGPLLVAVDMPIGLPERAGPGGRATESAVRPLLGARQSSVFSVPARAAIYADGFGEACRIGLATSDPPRKLSKPLFMLVPKIREVDGCLRRDAGAARRVFEVHPELAFWRLNGGRALTEPKKIKRRCHEPGLALRRALLAGAGFSEALVASQPPKGAGADDLLDALACAAVAQRIAAGVAVPFPNPPPRDGFGLPMAIWA